MGWLLTVHCRFLGECRFRYVIYCLWYIARVLTREDYQTFASENSEQLAKAIEKGIPKALRGMIWQLM